MAFRDLEQSESTGIPAFYNLSMAVGRWAANRKDDVMLVQFLLSEFYAKKPMGPSFATPPGDMKIDGIFGKITGSWLLTLQQDLRKLSFPVLADGRADRVRGTISSISRTIYTMSILNTMVGQVRDDFADLHLSTDIPNELAFQLF